MARAAVRGERTKKKGLKKDYKGKRDSAGYAKGSSYGAGSRKDSGGRMESGGRLAGAKPGARGARDAQAVVHAPRASKKKKGEDWQNDFTEFFARQEQGGWGGKSGFDKKPLPARIKNAETVNCFSEAGSFPIAMTCFPMTGSVRFS